MRGGAFAVALGMALGGLGACQGPSLFASRPAPAAGEGEGHEVIGACATRPDDGGACARSRPVLACDVINARDLGGVPLAPAGAVACGALFRGPPLAGLSTTGCADVARLGLRTIIDLRTDDERRSRPDDPCVTAAVLPAPLPVPYSVSPEDYVADLDTAASIATVFHALGAAASYPIYFHCTYGRDRTGVVAALVFLALGVSREDILSEYALSAASVGAFPESLTAVLNEVERRGGVEQVLSAAGVTAGELAVLRSRARIP
jgi:protein-tyrosine phosphatase